MPFAGILNPPTEVGGN